MDSLWFDRDHQEAAHGNLNFGLNPILSCFDKFNSVSSNCAKLNTPVLQNWRKLVQDLFTKNREKLKTAH